MGLSDVPPPHSLSACPYLIPFSFLLLALGVFLWDVHYILLFLASSRHRTHSIPLLTLSVNIAWEVVYAVYVSETWLEKVGFASWLLLDLPVVWVTLEYYYNYNNNNNNNKYGKPKGVTTKPRTRSRRELRILFAVLVGVAMVGQWGFISWWLGEAGRGLYGALVVVGEEEGGSRRSKQGKFWRGREGYDTTELAFWSAGFAQVLGSVQSLSLLVRRGHSGGTGWWIWATRSLGSICGMELCSGLLWWYWPEAHGYFVSWPSIFMCSLQLGCDIAYGVVLWKVRRTEKIFKDGRVVRGDYKGE